MNAKETKMLSIIDKQIEELQKMKKQLLETKPLSEIVKDKPYLWLIQKSTNTYYQFVGFGLGDDITISRHGVSYAVSRSHFDNTFKIASSVEFKQHIEHLERTGKSYIEQDFRQRVEQREASEIGIDLYRKLLEQRHNSEYDRMVKDMVHTIDPKKCDFYMVTVTGEFGAKVRHDNYDNAIKEATRLAKKQNHKAWVTGVVAVIEPIQQEVQVKVIEK